MIKLLPAFLFLFYSFVTHSQQNMLAFKKGNIIIRSFWKGNFIAFQLKNQEWRKGEITKIQHDSFYIRPTIVQYNMMGADTFHFPVQGFSFSDVYAMPKRGYLIDFVDGRFQVSRTGGHVHFYWIKSGLLFRLGAAGYATVNLINGLINDDLSIKDGRLAIAAGAFLFGVLLKHIYKPVLRVGKKYHLEMINYAG